MCRDSRLFKGCSPLQLFCSTKGKQPEIGPPNIPKTFVSPVMRLMLYALTVFSLMTSCATIMNQPYKDITIYTTQPSEIILKRDTLETNENKATLKVERKKETLIIVAKTESITRTFKVEPKNSFMYWSNIVCNYGTGMFVDRNNPKRYTYPQKVYLNPRDTVGKYSKYGQANNKGELYLHLSLPHINSFHLTPEHEGKKMNTGFWGLTIGMDYFHSKNQFVHLGVTAVSDFFVPVPAAVDISGEYELMSSRYISLSNNHKINRFSVGYGFSYARNTWDLRYYDRFDPFPPTREPVKKSHSAVGLIFPTYFQMGENFNIGVVYRPTFYRPDMTDKFKYEHLISIDFAWKIRLMK